jgi:hypothetical protein
MQASVKRKGGHLGKEKYVIAGKSSVTNDTQQCEVMPERAIISTPSATSVELPAVR